MGVAADFFDQPNGHGFKEAGVADDADQHHHADDEKEDI